MPHGRLALGVEREKLLGHVVDGFAHARLARFPDRRAQPVERGRLASQRLVFLHQVKPRERHVELRVVRVVQQHEFAGRAFDHHLPQAFELPDAVIHVHHIVARLQIGEIAEETRRLRPRARSLGRRKRLEKIGVAVDREPRLGKHHAFGQRRFHEHHRGRVAAAAFLRQPRHRHVFFQLAQAVGQFVFVADIGKALEFARARGGNHHMLARAEPAPHFGHERGHVSVVARGRLRLHGERRQHLPSPTPDARSPGAGRVRARATIPLRRKCNGSGGSASGSSASSKASASRARYFSIAASSSDGSSRTTSGSAARSNSTPLRSSLQHLAKFPAGIETPAARCRRGRTDGARAALEHFGMPQRIR